MNSKYFWGHRIFIPEISTKSELILVLRPLNTINLIMWHWDYHHWNMIKGKKATGSLAMLHGPLGSPDPTLRTAALNDSAKKNNAQPIWIRSLLCSMIPASCFPLLKPVLIDIWQYSCLNGQKITQGGSEGESGHTLPLETVESRLTRFQWVHFLCFLLTLP